MSTSDPLPVAADLHASIEQLIATAVQGSRANHDDHLTAVLRETLADIEAQQTALAAIATKIRTALESTTAGEPAISEPEPESAPEVPTPVATPEISQATDRGPHEIDVIAHGTTLTQASGLQSLLREMSQVTELQTRQFVSGELRLHAIMANSIDASALTAWLNENAGTIITFANDVIEISFSS